MDNFRPICGRYLSIYSTVSNRKVNPTFSVHQSWTIADGLRTFLGVGTAT